MLLGFITIKIDVNLRNKELLFHLQISNPFNIRHQLLGFCCFGSENIQIIAKKLSLCDILDNLILIDQIMCILKRLAG